MCPCSSPDIPAPSFPIDILDTSLHLVTSNDRPDVLPVLLHLESLHTILDDVQTLRHVQRDKEHAVLVTKLSVVLVDGTGVLEVSTIVEQLVFAESKVFLCASTRCCVNEGGGGRGGSGGTESERVGG